MVSLQDLTQKEMTRREFLVVLGCIILTVFGFSTIIQMITGKDMRHYLTGSGTNSSYGRDNKK